MIIFPMPVLILPDHLAALEDVQLDSGSYVFRDESILGTRMQINLVARNFFDARTAALNARAEIDRLNTILKSADAQSELHALNHARTHRASPELFAVVAAAEHWRAETAGAFSGRLGRVIDVWKNASTQIPSRVELARIARAADEALVDLDSSSRTITRPDEVEFVLD